MADSLKDSVAVIGVGCRVPGAESPEEFWETLKAGRNHVVDIPNERWSAEAYYDPSYDAPGKAYVNKAALIDGVHEYDTRLFGVNDLEAERIDPQHKLALEVSYRAVESAGLTEEGIKGTDTAVFLGQFTCDYGNLISMDATYVDNYTATGVPSCMMSNRISYAFDLHGPSVTVDTACSSSMVAVHLGCRSILNGESTMALCGGANLILTPALLIALSKARMASRKGQCFSFSEQADGYVRGEGSVVVLLKNAEQAIKDGNNIWGFVHTCCNSDGKASVPISTPSFEMQKRVIGQTLRKAGMANERVDYVEMHGTGTTAGDAVESSSVGQTIGQARKRASKCALKIGSVKTNIGHLEASAGTAALLKLLLMMKHGQFVPTLFADTPSPAIDFQGLHIEVAKTMEPWENGPSGMRVGAVNSFGVGGTNIHAIVTSGRKSSRKVSSAVRYNNKKHPVVIAFSGSSEKSIRNSMSELTKAVKLGWVTKVEDVLLTSHNIRQHYRHRFGLVTMPTMEDMTQTLDKTLEQSSLATVTGKKLQNNLVFVFCGMGTHWHRMGQEFYETVDVFRETIDKIDQTLVKLGKFTVKQCLEGQHDLTDPMYGQPAIFATQVGLYRMWGHHGIVPDVILGHSVGEVAAAYCSNHLTLDSAVKVIYQRARLLSKCQGGGMLVVGNFQTKEVEGLIGEHLLEDKVNVAAYNSSRSCTVSGDTNALKKLETALTAAHEKDKVKDKLFLRQLQVKVAYHSQYMDPVLKDLETSLSSINHGSGPYIKHISSVLATEASHRTFANGEYWCKNVRNPVLFQEGFEKCLLENCNNLVVEVGPRPALRSYIKDIGKSHQMASIASMAENNCNPQFFSSLAKLYEHGLDLHYPGNPEDIRYPRFGFDRKNTKRYPDKINRPLVTSASNHGFISPSPEAELSSKVTLSKTTSPFVFDHILGGKIIVPGSTYVECAATTTFIYEPNLYSEGRFMRIAVNFNQHCRLADEDSKETLTTMLFPKEDSGMSKAFDFNITSPDVLHASGHIELAKMEGQRETIDLKAIRSRLSDSLPEGEPYSTLKKFKFEHGPSLQCVKSGWRNEFEILARVKLDDEFGHEYCTLHPVLMDSPLTLSVMFASVQSLSKSEQQVMPFGVRSISIFSKPPMMAYLYCVETEKTDTKIEVEAYITDELGNVCVHCQGIKTGLVGQESNLSLEDICFELQWEDVQIVKNNNNGNRVGMKNEEAVAGKRGKGEAAEANVSYMVIMEAGDTQMRERLNQMGLSNIVEVTVKTLATSCEDVEHFRSILCLENITNLIFTLPCAEVDCQVSGEEMCDQIADRGYIFIKLLQFVQQYYSQVVVHVLTSAVYPLMNNENSQTPETGGSEKLSGVIGNSFWAMVRSVSIEMPYLRIQLIDLADFEEDTLQHLLKVIGQEVSDNMLAIRGYSAKACSLGEMPRGSFDNPRSLLVSEETAVTLCMSKKDKLVYESKASELEGSNRTKKCHLKSVYILQQDINNCLTSDTVASELTCIGGKGMINKDEVHVIQKITATSVLLADKVWFIPAEVLPLQYPTATLWYVAWTMCRTLQSELARGDGVKIMSLDNTKLWKVVTEQVCTLAGLPLNVESQSMRIIAIASSAADARYLVHQCGKSKITKAHILTWDSGLAFRIRQRIRQDFPSMNTQVTSVDGLLEGSVLMECCNVFKKWLGKMKKKNLQVSIEEVDRVVSENIKGFHISDMAQVMGEGVQGDIHVSFSEMNKPLSVTANKTTLFQKNAGYLIFGGSKGLGWETAQHMAKNGAGKIGIVSRRGIGEEKERQLSELTSSTGCEFVDLRADVSNFRDLQNVFIKFKAANTRLTGVFIGAVVLDDATIPNMTHNRFRAVLQAKVAGTWNIHQLTKDSRDLDYFVIHSSVTSIIGRPGQTHYGSGCAFGDALARFRQLTLGCGQSIRWGALNLGVLEDREGAKKRLANAGIVSLNTQETMQCFEHVLTYNRPLVCYARFNWRAILKKSGEIVKSEANPFRKLLGKKTYYIVHKQKKLGEISNNPLPSGEASEFLVQLLTSVLMLDVEEIGTDMTLDALGADSHQVTIIYSTMVSEYGSVGSSLTPIDLLGMKVLELYRMLKEEEGKGGAKGEGGEPPEVKGQGQESRKHPEDEKDGTFQSNEYQVINLTEEGSYRDSSLQLVDVLVCLDRNTSAVRQLVIWGKSGQKAVRINVEDIQGISLQAEESSLPAVEILTRSAGTLPINAENPDQSHSLHSKLSQYFPDHLYNKGQISKRSDTDQSNTIDGDKSKEIQTPDSDFSSGYASDSREPDVSSATSRDSLSSVSNGAQNKKVESKTCTIL